jgi:transposase
MKQSGLFGLSDHLKRLSANGDPLEELGWIVDFEGFRPILTQGNVADCTQAEALLKDIDTDNVLADKGGACPGLRAGNSDAIVEIITANGASAVIPPKSNRIIQRPCDFALYCERNLVERFFNKACTGEGRYQALSRHCNQIYQAPQKLYGICQFGMCHVMD